MFQQALADSSLIRDWLDLIQSVDEINENETSNDIKKQIKYFSCCMNSTWPINYAHLFQTKNYVIIELFEF